MTKWHLVQISDEYIDFDREVMNLPDDGNTSLDVRLTFVLADRVAYMLVSWHNDDGNTHDLDGERRIEWGAAVEMVKRNCDEFPEELR